MIITEMLIVVAATVNEGVDVRRCMSRNGAAKFLRSIFRHVCTFGASVCC